MHTLLFCFGDGMQMQKLVCKVRMEWLSGAGFSPDNAHDASWTKASAVFLSGLFLAEQGDA
jgi:hypothetical protein